MYEPEFTVTTQPPASDRVWQRQFLGSRGERTGAVGLAVTVAEKTPNVTVIVTEIATGKRVFTTQWHKLS